MIECPNCREITITKTVSGYFVCNNCGLDWHDEAYTVALPVNRSKLPVVDMNEQDVVNHPHHYANGMTVEVECIMFTRWLDFDLGNAFKYVWRSGSKDNAVQDLEKAVWYLEDAIVYGITCCKKELLPFLPKSALPEWKYDTLRCILNGKVEDARLEVLEHLNSVKPAHNNRKR